jgi:hypothetical protein
MLCVAIRMPYTVEVKVRPVSALQSNVLEILMRFRGPDGQLADPTTVTLRLKKPDATELTPAPFPIRLGPGVWQYYFDTQGKAPGVWTYRAEGDGALEAALEGTFTVTGSAF